MKKLSFVICIVLLTNNFSNAQSNYRILNKIPVEGDGGWDYLTVDDETGRLFISHSTMVQVIDAKKNKVIGTIALDGKPEFAVTDNKGKIYVNIEDKSLIKEINSSTLKVENEWKIAPGEEPSGLALDIENKILFSVCDNNTM